MRTVLILEDEPHMVEVLERDLRPLGYETVVTASGREALDLARTRPFDLGIFDRMVEHIPGDDVCKRLRAERIDFPILMISAALDIVAAAQCGASDVLSKPFATTAFVERVLFMTARQSLDGVIEVGLIRLDERRGVVEVGGQVVQGIEGKTFELLRYMLRRAGDDVPKGDLSRHVWRVRSDGSNTIAVHMSHLRKALGEPAKYQLKTTATGYLLDGDPTPRGPLSRRRPRSHDVTLRRAFS